jgi:hypothetical protein
MSMDEHHLTLEFAQWIGKQLAVDPPLWLQDLRYRDSERQPAGY